jgi:hypothetical protein
MRRACLHFSLLLLGISSAMLAYVNVRRLETLVSQGSEWNSSSSVRDSTPLVQAGNNLGFVLLGLALLAPRRRAHATMSQIVAAPILQRAPLVAMMPAFRIGLLVSAAATGGIVLLKVLNAPLIDWRKLGLVLILLRFLGILHLSTLGLMVLRRSGGHAGRVRDERPRTEGDINSVPGSGGKRYGHGRIGLISGLATLTSCSAFFVLSNLSTLDLLPVTSISLLSLLSSLSRIFQYGYVGAFIFLCLSIYVWMGRKRASVCRVRAALEVRGASLMSRR